MIKVARNSVRSLLILTLGSLAMACGNPTSTAQLGLEPVPADTACTQGQAQITIRDGSVQNLCGCNEAAGKVFFAGDPTSLSCTVAVGTTVFFLYVSKFNKHQILSTGTPSFLASPLNNPHDSHPYRVHAVALTAAGTYVFQDAFMPGLTGRIVAQ